jgi:hypothetical protein
MASEPSEFGDEAATDELRSVSAMLRWSEVVRVRRRLGTQKKERERERNRGKSE